MIEIIQIEEMTVDDIDDIMEIEKQTFSSRWPRSIYYAEIVENPFAHYYTIKYDGKIVGYAGIWLMKEGAQVTNIAISPDYQGKKLGEKLFSFIFQKALNFGCDNLSLEVRKSNVVAQNLYKKFGLVPAGIRKGYYTDNNEDAILMWVKF